MRLSSCTLLDVCANPKWLGGTPGLTAVLHTWTRQYEYHPHVHFIATGGGINAQGHWREAHPKFLVPVPALSPCFPRTLPRCAARAAPRRSSPRSNRRSGSRTWVVHSKPVGSGEKTLAYLARYVYRVALSNRAHPGIHTGTCHGALSQERHQRAAHHASRTRTNSSAASCSTCCRRASARSATSDCITARSEPQLRGLQAAMALQLGQPLPEPPADEDELRPGLSALSDAHALSSNASPHSRTSRLRRAAGITRGPPMMTTLLAAARSRKSAPSRRGHVTGLSTMPILTSRPTSRTSVHAPIAPNHPCLSARFAAPSKSPPTTRSPDCGDGKHIRGSSASLVQQRLSVRASAH